MRAIILAVEVEYVSPGRSNIGGWHSRTDFLNRPEAAVGALTTWISDDLSRRRVPWHSQPTLRKR
jgi:hypothetical protein